MRGIELTSAEREEISRCLVLGDSYRVIGRRLGRHHSVISREVGRNGGREGYRALRADKRAAACKARPKPRKICANHALLAAVNEGLAKCWSPRQIQARLHRDYPGDHTMHVSPPRSTKRCMCKPEAPYGLS